jgi:adenylate cyclase
MTILQPPTDGDHEDRVMSSRTSSALIDKPVGLNLSTSMCVEASTVVQSTQVPQPALEQTKDAAKAIAALDLPEPGGPTNNHEWVIACEDSSLFAV